MIAADGDVTVPGSVVALITLLTGAVIWALKRFRPAPPASTRALQDVLQAVAALGEAQKEILEDVKAVRLEVQRSSCAWLENQVPGGFAAARAAEALAESERHLKASEGENAQLRERLRRKEGLSP